MHGKNEIAWPAMSEVADTITTTTRPKTTKTANKDLQLSDLIGKAAK